MSLENTLERIAVALETLAGKPAATPVDPTDTVTPPAAATAVPASPVRGRGRPAKSAGETPAPVAPAAPAAPEVDPFAMDEPTPPPPEKVTLKDVQAALVAYQKRVNSPEKARALLKEVGGVDVLPKLPEAKWGAVVNAANAG